MRHSRGAAASWQLRGLLQQQQETWHFECIVPVSKMHFRDVTLMGLCFGRLALARVGNFCVYQAKTWHQRSDNWLHLCKSVSVLLFRVLCLGVNEFWGLFFFSNTAWLCLRFTSRPVEKISRLSSRKISLLLTRHNDKALGQFIQFRHGIKKKWTHVPKLSYRN